MYTCAGQIIIDLTHQLNHYHMYIHQYLHMYPLIFTEKKDDVAFK